MNGWSRGSLLLIGLAFLGPRLVHAQEAAEVTCKDGTTSKGGKGACSGHGGVDKSAPKAAAEPATKATSSSSSKSHGSEAAASTAAAPTSAPAQVTCKDGTTSHGGKGACSGHGGVDKTALTGESKTKKATRSPTSWEGSSSSGTAPTASAAPGAAAAAGGAAAAEVTCKDGTTSHGGKGACSGHGGVDKSASGSAHGGTSAAAATSAPAPGVGGSSAPAASAPARTAAPAPAATSPAPTTPTSHGTAAGEKGPPTAKCKDGSLSYAQHHSGACSDHGGVAQWLDGTQK